MNAHQQDIEYTGQTIVISGDFGQLIISPRDPDAGPGVFIALDNDSESKLPTVLMVGDRIERYIRGIEVAAGRSQVLCDEFGCHNPNHPETTT